MHVEPPVTALRVETEPTVQFTTTGFGVWELRAPSARPIAPEPHAAKRPEPASAQVAVTAALKPPAVVVPVARYRIEVSNGNGRNELARHVADALRSRGNIEKARLTNRKPFGEVASYIEYAPGARGAAVHVAEGLPVSVPMTEVRVLDRGMQVKVVLGRDFPAAPVAASRTRTLIAAQAHSSNSRCPLERSYYS